MRPLTDPFGLTSRAVSAVPSRSWAPVGRQVAAATPAAFPRRGGRQRWTPPGADGRAGRSRRVSSTSPSSGALSGHDGGAARSACITVGVAPVPGNGRFLSPARASVAAASAVRCINGSGSEPWLSNAANVDKRISVELTTARDGSRRNHVRWRFANATFRRASARDRRLERHRRRGPPSLAVADRRERRQRRVEPLAERARLLDEAGVELGAGAIGDPAPVLGRFDDRARATATGAG